MCVCECVCVSVCVCVCVLHVSECQCQCTHEVAGEFSWVCARWLWGALGVLLRTWPSSSVFSRTQAVDWLLPDTQEKSIGAKKDG